MKERAARGAPIAFFKGEGQRYRSVLERADGVTVEFDGGSYNKVGGRPGRVPHDLAHYVVEDALGLDFGVWGVIAAGGLFRHIEVIDGRQAPHAAKRGREIVARGKERIAEAELRVREAADAALAGDDGPLSRRMRQMGERWERLAPGESIDVVWTLPEPKR